jgi:hypothetical protein
VLQFVHDQIREIMLSLIPCKELPRLQHAIGRDLLDHLDPPDLESMFFVMVNLISAVEDEQDKVAAYVNQQAALRALELGAFSSAKIFTITGISHLPEKEAWKYTPGMFDLAMDLHALAAQAEASLNNFDAAEQLCEVILGEDDATMMQKCAAHKVALQKCAGYKQRLTTMHYLKAWNPSAPNSALEQK